MYKFVDIEALYVLRQRTFGAQDSFEMNDIIPSFLKSGDTIGIAATARWISPDQLGFAESVFTSWGYRTRPGKHISTKNFQQAGTPLQRLSDLQNLMDDPEIKAIVIARGGYGTVHLVDQLDFSQFMKFPKWICGYSDITVLHSHLNSMGIASIHSTMPVSFRDATPEALNTLKHALSGEMRQIDFNADSAINEENVLSDVCPIFGGNLSVLYSLLGSASLQPRHEFFLFLEDVDEMFYHVDRMMMALKRAGLLNKAKGVIVGGLTQMKDNTREFGFPTDNPWGSSALQTITRICSEIGLPVFSGFPSGHQNDNRAFYLGVMCRVVANKPDVSIQFQHQ